MLVKKAHIKYFWYGRVACAVRSNLGYHCFHTCSFFLLSSFFFHFFPLLLLLTLLCLGVHFWWSASIKRTEDWFWEKMEWCLLSLFLRTNLHFFFFFVFVTMITITIILILFTLIIIKMTMKEVWWNLTDWQEKWVVGNPTWCNKPASILSVLSIFSGATTKDAPQNPTPPHQDDHWPSPISPISPWKRSGENTKEAASRQKPSFPSSLVIRILIIDSDNQVHQTWSSSRSWSRS